MSWWGPRPGRMPYAIKAWPCSEYTNANSKEYLFGCCYIGLSWVVCYFCIRQMGTLCIGSQTSIYWRNAEHILRIKGWDGSCNSRG